MADVTYQRGTNLAGYTTPNGYVLQGARQGASPLPYIGMGGTRRGGGKDACCKANSGEGTFTCGGDKKPKKQPPKHRFF